MLQLRPELGDDPDRWGQPVSVEEEASPYRFGSKWSWVVGSIWSWAGLVHRDLLHFFFVLLFFFSVFPFVS
jgi:hypothetical protein